MFLSRELLLPWRRTNQGAQALAARLLRSSSSLSDPDDDPPFTRSRIPKPLPRAPSPPPKPKALAGKIRPDEPAHSDLPFDFRYSYSETDPAWRPIGFHEPARFSPFGPGRLDRPWDGVAAARGGGGDGGGAGRRFLGNRCRRRRWRTWWRGTGTATAHGRSIWVSFCCSQYRNGVSL